MDNTPYSLPTNTKSYYGQRVSLASMALVQPTTQPIASMITAFRSAHPRCILLYHYLYSFKHAVLPDTLPVGLTPYEMDLMICLENRLSTLWNEQHPQFKAPAPISDLEETTLQHWLEHDKKMQHVLEYLDDYYHNPERIAAADESFRQKQVIFNALAPLVRTSLTLSHPEASPTASNGLTRAFRIHWNKLKSGYHHHLKPEQLERYTAIRPFISWF